MYNAYSQSILNLLRNAQQNKQKLAFVFTKCDKNEDLTEQDQGLESSAVYGHFSCFQWMHPSM